MKGRKENMDIKLIKQIGKCEIDSHKSYGLFSDGNVWYYGERLICNCGELDEFLRNARNIKVKLIQNEGRE
jgi:hypothetical protein